MKDILICGYYGFKNSGDDALLLSIIQQLKGLNKDLRISVLSNNPAETNQAYGIDAKKRDNIYELFKAIINCRMLILGGGTLIQDRTSTKSLVYYLTVILLALIFKKKVMLYANGIGPLKHKRLASRILNRVDLITLRDENSLAELKEMGVMNPHIELTADCAFSLDFSRKPSPFKDSYFCVSVREYKNLPADFCRLIADTCDYIYKKFNCYPIFIPFQKDKDLNITKEIISLMTQKSEILSENYELEDIMGIISDAKLCIGMRLHSLIYSSLCSIPLIGLVYDPKVSGFMEYIGQSRYLDSEKLAYDELVNSVDYCFVNNVEIKKDMAKRLENMRELSQKNAQLAIELLEE